LVDEIKLDGNELVVRGSHRRLADAIGFMQRKKLGEVPSFVNDWRARWDSNYPANASFGRMPCFSITDCSTS
jgi:hypothetical protein